MRNEYALENYPEIGENELLCYYPIKQHVSGLFSAGNYFGTK